MFVFTDVMIDECGGKRFCISAKKQIFLDSFSGKIPYDGFEYSLEGDGGYGWTSYMFEESGDWRDEDSKPSEGKLKYGGEIADFPKEVVEKMLERQYEQTGKRDVSVFEMYARQGQCGGGFYWRKTIEGHSFWVSVIEDKNFDTFFERYPKSGKTRENPILVLGQDDFLKDITEQIHTCIAEMSRISSIPKPEASPKTSIYRRKKGFVPFGKVSKIRPVETVLHKKSK